MTETAELSAKDLGMNIWGKGEKSEPQHPELTPQNAPNEFNKRGKIVLSPLQEVIVNRRDYTSLVRNNLDYLSTTHGFEVDTPKVARLQELTDKMLEGSGSTARVVILERGEEPEAFVLPDGTICISQSLINALDTIDEIGGVLEHEINHILNGTSKQKLGTDENTYGLCWTHETASDLGSPDLAEKAGLNSTGLASAIEKISANSRGQKHQTGEMRGAQVMGIHAMKHYATSDIEQTPIPTDWKAETVLPTNLALAERLAKDPQTDEADLTELVAKLHIQDLADLYAKVFTRTAIDACQNILTERLVRAGYSSDDIANFFIDFERTGLRDTRIVNGPNHLITLAEKLEDLETNAKLSEIYRVVFDKERNQKSSPTKLFLGYLQNNMFLEDGDPVRKGVPVTDDSLLQTLLVIQEQSPVYDMPNKSEALSFCIGPFFRTIYNEASKNSSGAIDPTWFVESATKFRDADLNLDKNALKRSLRTYINADQAQEIVAFILPKEESEKNHMEEFDKMISRFFVDAHIINQHLPLEGKISDFTLALQHFFSESQFDDTQREPYVQHLLQRMDEFQDTTSSEAKILQDDIMESSGEVEADTAKLAEMRRFIVKTRFAAYLYNGDSEQHYQSLETIMESTSLDPAQLSLYELYAINSSLLGQFRVNDIPRFMELPFIQALQEKKLTYTAPTTLSEMKKEINKLKLCLGNDRKISGDIFSDSLSTLFVFSEMRSAFCEYLKRGVPDDEKQILLDFMSMHIEKNPTTNRVKRQLLKEILAQQTTLTEKIDFLHDNFEQLGYEGVVTLAEQINTMDEYEQLRAALGNKVEEYLGPKMSTDVAAGLDWATSHMTKDFEQLLKTASSDATSTSEMSTEMAGLWLSKYIGSYNEDTKRFDMYGIDRPTFRSLQDVFTTLHDLPESQRASLVMKALLDVNGGLTTKYSRQHLGELTVKSLNINDPFLQQVLRSACSEADAKVVGYPLSVLFAPLLFKGLDASAADMFQLMDVSARNDYSIRVRDVMRSTQMLDILQSTTSDIIQFGPQYKKHSGTYPAELADTAQKTFLETYGLFEAMIEPTTEEVIAPLNDDIDPGIDAVINGVQASGAVGVRSLQLARQLMKFSPAVESRLSGAFDSNPGLNKLLMWENLHNFRQKRAIGDVRYEEAGKFIAENVVSVGDKLGGGSLYTTYDAIVLDEVGQEVSSVIKILNPNATLIIESFHKVALDSLEKVKAEGDPDAIRKAEQAIMLVELAQQWCLADINDPSFVADDSTFSEMIAGFNEENPGMNIYAPRRIFNSYFIKSEAKAEGETLNAILNNDDVEPQQRRHAVEAVIRLFDYELSHPIKSGTEFLLRSDPNPGNFMVDTGEASLAILDRNLFLHLPHQEASAIKNLWDGNEEAFFEGFVRSIFSHNKIGRLRQPILGLQLRHFITREVEQAGGKENVEPLALMQEVMGELDKKGLEVPLRMHLAIKNVFALQELKRRYLNEDQSL